MNNFFMKYNQVGSCFEVFVIKNTIVQSEFNFDAPFNEL
jgi:hypothetical protein